MKVFIGLSWPILMRLKDFIFHVTKEKIIQETTKKGETPKGRVNVSM